MLLRSNIPPALGPRAPAEPLPRGADPTDTTPARGHRCAPATRDPERALRALVEAHAGIVWRSLRAFGVHHDDVDDALQQVFVIAARKLGTIVTGSERAFLVAAARGIAANYRRGRRRNPEVADEGALVAQVDGTPSAEDLAVESEARRTLHELVHGLEDDVREVFVLFELEELSTAEIATIVGVPQGTVASRLRRGRAAFQAAIERLRASRTSPRGGAR